jgi:uncharacterized membrane protein YhaH (DUF805 family)
MTFGESISAVLGKYATFGGRASRSEYWWFYLFSVLLSWGASVVGVAIFGANGASYNLIPALALMIPSMAVLTRRMHDTGRSGWNWLWAFTIIGVIPVIIWLAAEGSKEENRYGPPTAFDRL